MLGRLRRTLLSQVLRWLLSPGTVAVVLVAHCSPFSYGEYNNQSREGPVGPLVSWFNAWVGLVSCQSPSMSRRMSSIKRFPFAVSDSKRNRRSAGFSTTVIRRNG